MSNLDYKKQFLNAGHPPDTLPENDGLTFEQSENHRRMVEDMTGRKFKPRQQKV